MAKKEQPAEPQPAAAPDYTGDEHWGKGGRYVIDPKTGKRIPAEQYKPDPVNEPEEVSNAD